VPIQQKMMVMFKNFEEKSVNAGVRELLLRVRVAGRCLQFVQFYLGPDAAKSSEKVFKK
jgi:hypothetical protein